MSYTNRSLSILLLALGCMVLWGCSKGVSPKSTTPVTAINPDNRFTFNISFGADMSYNAINLTFYINAKFKIDGINASFSNNPRDPDLYIESGSMYLNVAAGDTLHAGIYPLGQTNFITITTPYAAPYPYNYSSNPGVVNVTTLKDSVVQQQSSSFVHYIHIIGTFSFTAVGSPGGLHDTLSVTNGQFDLRNSYPSPYH